MQRLNFLQKKYIFSTVLLLIFIITFKQQSFAENTTDTTDKKSTKFEKEIKIDQKLSDGLLYLVETYKPNYILPFYYTFSPYDSIYQGQTPNNEGIDSAEVKFQISFAVTVIPNLFSTPNLDLRIAYSQLSYWQLYNKSAFFRESNYEPAIFLRYIKNPNWEFETGIFHQSNGRGGPTERTWNRLYAQIGYNTENFLIYVKPWLSVLKGDTYNENNSNITDYLGNGEVTMSYLWGEQDFSVMFRNHLESGFKRGAVELSYSIPIYGHIRAYAQAFMGYGQSLIEYDHYTNAVGIGVSLNDWLM